MLYASSRTVAQSPTDWFPTRAERDEYLWVKRMGTCGSITVQNDEADLMLDWRDGLEGGGGPADTVTDGSDVEIQLRQTHKRKRAYTHTLA